MGKRLELLLWLIASAICFAWVCEGATMQFRSKLAPAMCAAGKSSWTDATGSGPLHLQPCKKKNRINKNTLFKVTEAFDPAYRILTRFNEKNQPFCLTNFGGPLPALAFENQCIIVKPEQQWDLARAPLIGFHATNYCWDTLGSRAQWSRITIQPCNPNSKSQQFVKVVIKQKQKQKKKKKNANKKKKANKKQG